MEEKYDQTHKLNQAWGIKNSWRKGAMHELKTPTIKRLAKEAGLKEVTMQQTTLNLEGSRNVLAALGEAPVITLKNGIRIANFSSPHKFLFNTGEELPACSADRATSLMLECEEVESPNPGGWTDIELQWGMSNAVMAELERLCGELSIDVVLVPFPVLQCIRQMAAVSDDRWELVAAKARTIRCADRVTKAIYSDRFCK